MARKKKPAEHPNHERWLVSYADFITLLFAFFVVMFAVSQVDSKKLGRFTESFAASLEWQLFEGKGDGMLKELRTTPIVGGQSVQPLGKVVIGRSSTLVPELSAFKDDLAEKMATTRELEGLDVVESHGELVMRLPERLLFETGGTAVNQDGLKALAAISDVIREHQVEVRIEGHTDDVPINRPPFRSNWELSTGRATAVIQYLVDTAKLEPRRLSASGYGEYRPIATNTTAEGRAQNRRVDIVAISVTPEAGSRP